MGFLHIFLKKAQKRERYKACMINNLKNPMFPKDRVGQLLADMISKYPFAQAEYKLLINVYGENDETKEIINYFNFSMD